LMAATVDSTGSANVNERVVLTIPQKTSGDAKQTSLVSLGLNFPADAAVITEKFNRANPATYNKSTAFTVYDNGGNGYLATIYYTKTSNANQNVPYNKWQTHVFVGEDQVNASLVQATDINKEKIYVNQYGQTKPYSAVKDELTTAKTKLFSLNELTAKRTSTAATVTGNIIPESGDGGYDWVAGIPSGDARLNSLLTNNAFTVDIDNSGTMSAQEFLQVLTRQHGTAAGLTLADAQEILADFDEDGSGSLDVEEFIQAMISMDPELAEELEEGESIVFKSAAKLSTAAALGGGQGTTEYA